MPSYLPKNTRSNSLLIWFFSASSSFTLSASLLSYAFTTFHILTRRKTGRNSTRLFLTIKFLAQRNGTNTTNGRKREKRIFYKSLVSFFEFFDLLGFEDELRQQIDKKSEKSSTMKEDDQIVNCSCIEIHLDLILDCADGRGTDNQQQNAEKY